jgi:hypothetical protein
MRSLSPSLVIILFACGLVAGCGPHKRAINPKGQATNAYFRSYEAVSSDAAAQIANLPRLDAPAAPSLSPQSTQQERDAFFAATRGHPAALDRYFAAVGDRCRALSEVYGRTTSRFSAIDATGVDELAVQVVALREHTIARRGELLGEIGRFAQLSRAALVRRQAPDDLIELAAQVLDEALKGGLGSPDDMVADKFTDALKGAGSDPAVQAERSALSGQIDRLLATSAQLKRELAEYLNKRAQATSAFQANYPDEDWDFIAQ